MLQFYNKKFFLYLLKNKYIFFKKTLQIKQILLKKNIYKIYIKKNIINKQKNNLGIKLKYFFLIKYKLYLNLIYCITYFKNLSIISLYPLKLKKIKITNRFKLLDKLKIKKLLIYNKFLKIRLPFYIYNGVLRKQKYNLSYNIKYIKNKYHLRKLIASKLRFHKKPRWVKKQMKARYCIIIIRKYWKFFYALKKKYYCKKYMKVQINSPKWIFRIKWNYNKYLWEKKKLKYILIKMPKRKLKKISERTLWFSLPKKFKYFGKQVRWYKRYKKIYKSIRPINYYWIKKIPKLKTFYLVIKRTINNFFVTLTNSFGEVKLSSSCGKIGIKSKKKRKNFDSLYNVISHLSKYILLLGILKIFTLYFKGRTSKYLIKGVLQRLNDIGIKVQYIKFLVSRAHNGMRKAKLKRL